MIDSYLIVTFHNNITFSLRDFDIEIGFRLLFKKEMILMHTHLIVSGHVQGVGFRFTAQQHATKYNLVGWVKNNPDGTVELEVEGPKNKINLFVNELEAGFNRF